MKVTLPEDYKNRMTIHQVEVAKKVIKWAKEDTSTPEDYFKLAVLHILHREKDSDGHTDGLDKVLYVTAEVTARCKEYDRLFEGSEFMDVVFEGYAKTWNGFIHVIASLSDICQFGGDIDYRDTMYYRFYDERKRRK